MTARREQLPQSLLRPMEFRCAGNRSCCVGKKKKKKKKKKKRLLAFLCEAALLNVVLPWPPDQPAVPVPFARR